MNLSPLSRQRLQGVHADLVQVVELAAQRVDAAPGSNLTFRVTEGLRTKERQQQLVRAGASHTMNSRHLTGHAVDLAAEVSGAVRWDWPLYHTLAQVMKRAALDLAIPLTWGGDWQMRDGPHFELPRREYPA